MLDFLKSLRGARETRVGLVAKQTTLAAKREELLRRPPDRAALIAWLERSIRVQADEYQRRLGAWYFSASAQARVPGTFFETDASVALLSVPSAVPWHGAESALAPTEALAPVASVALSFYLRDAMLAEVPRIVDRFFPDAARGISVAARASALAKLDTEIASTEADLAELDAALDDAKRAVA